MADSIASSPTLRHAIELADQIELGSLLFDAAFEAIDIGDRRRGRLEDRSLIRSRQEPARQIVEPADRHQAAVEDHKTRQVAILAAEAVAEPRRPCSAGRQCRARCAKSNSRSCASENCDVSDRTTHRSSAHFARYGNKSLIHKPLCPRWRNFHGDASTLPTSLNCVGCTFNSSCGLRRSCSARSGFGSKVSTCDGPPSM